MHLNGESQLCFKPIMNYQYEYRYVRIKTLQT